jgi:hypothetical protein
MTKLTNVWFPHPAFKEQSNSNAKRKHRSRGNTVPTWNCNKAERQTEVKELTEAGSSMKSQSMKSMLLGRWKIRYRVHNFTALDRPVSQFNSVPISYRIYLSIESDAVLQGTLFLLGFQTYVSY